MPRFITQEIFSINFLLFKAQREHFVTASLICCAEHMTDLVSVRVGILSGARRRGGRASFTLDVERKRERLEERMGRESRDKPVKGKRQLMPQTPLAVAAVYLRRPGGVIVLHRRAAEEETHTGDKRVLNLQDRSVPASSKMYRSTHKYVLPLHCLSVFLVPSLCHTDTSTHTHISSYSLIVRSFIDTVHYPGLYSNLLLP